VALQAQGLPTPLSPPPHAPQEIWKASEAGSTDRGQSDSPNWVTFYGFTSDATVRTLVVPNVPTRRLLFVGDSFTFGAGTMVGRTPIGKDGPYVCNTTSDYYPSANNYWSYGAILCRWVCCVWRCMHSSPQPA
jgi:hypothetical protein